ncbi:hypothetical protein EVAR_14701_1 [Eumeta japonica]|uniref:Uncharacterized protein n=1 Tax=Eumeta variegata TaxID=151549 RepID=A0A4C1U2B8_EUMVA|nr:hypothetical protein EVAR_14701_1 [Eumeta japonica]
MLYSWSSIIASPNAAGRHAGVSTARDMLYGRFLKGSPRHRSHWIPTRGGSILPIRRGSGRVEYGSYGLRPNYDRVLHVLISSHEAIGSIHGNRRSYIASGSVPREASRLRIDPDVGAGLVAMVVDDFTSDWSELEVRVFPQSRRIYKIQMSTASHGERLQVVGDPVISGQLDPSASRGDVASPCMPYRIYYGERSEELFNLIPAANFRRRVPLAGNTITTVRRVELPFGLIKKKTGHK